MNAVVRLKRTILIIVCILICTVFIIIPLIIVAAGSKNRVLIIGEKSIDTNIEDIGDLKRISEIIGLKTENEPESVNEIRIPLYFNDVYTNYNDLMRQIGADLENYKGMKCLEYNFRVLSPENYCDDTLTFLVCGGRLIGGSLSGKEFGSRIRSLAELQ